MSRSRTGIPPIHSNRVGSLGSVMEGYHSDRWLLPDETARKLRATRPPRAVEMNDSSCAPAHDTPLPLKRSPPASFKRLLGVTPRADELGSTPPAPEPRT